MSRLALAACVAVSLLPVALADDAPQPLKFAWPVPSKTTVTERIEKMGHKATTRYVVTLEAGGKDGDLRVHMSDFEFVEFEGRPASDPEFASQIEQATAKAKVIPDILLSPDGRVKDVVGLDAVIDQQLAEIEKSGSPEQKADLPALRAMLHQPAAMAVQRREATRYWTAWVGEWIGRSIPEGGKVETKHPVLCPDNVVRDAPTVLRRAASQDGPGMAQFSRESVIDGDDAKPVVEAYVKMLNERTGRVPPEITGMRLFERAVVSTDPATLRPKRAYTEAVSTLHLKGQDDRVSVERHEYSFEWATAETAKPATDK